MPDPRRRPRLRQVVGLCLAAVLAALGCLALGRWQWHRYQDKHDRKQQVVRNYDADPVPVERLLPPDAGDLATADGWRPVRATGRYDAAHTVLVRNRPRDVAGDQPTFGYEVLVPLVLGDGRALLVDRGWVPNGTTGTTPGQRPDAVPSPPAGVVEVVARLRPSEPRRPGDLPSGQVASVAVPQVGELTGVRLLPAYAVLASESPSASPAPAPIGRPELDGGEGINASYAVQWVLFALLALGFPAWWWRRGRAEQQTDRTATAAQPARPRRRRIWDADDE